MTTPDTPTPHQTADSMAAFHDDILRVMEQHGATLSPHLLAIVLADVYTSFAVFLDVSRESVIELVGRLYDNAHQSHTHHTAH